MHVLSWYYGVISRKRETRVVYTESVNLWKVKTRGAVADVINMCAANRVSGHVVMIEKDSSIWVIKCVPATGGGVFSWRFIMATSGQ